MSEKNKNNVKEQKFTDGHKQNHISHNEPLLCEECGVKISQREQHKNGGLCDDCFGLD